MASNSSEIDDKMHWYKDAIIYELHIKAFRDSDRNGIGDFKGLIEKLDYLQDLGVTAIWVLPFYPSPLRDDGYDIADYYSINERYGTLEQFQQFLEEAHKRKLKVITELVINHTSDQHPWFQRARSAPANSPERNYYVWSDDPKKYADVRIIFQDFENSNWTWDPVAKQYYWHRFFHHQPDLNYDNLQVQEEIFRIIDYWCSMGVDGFRLDAVPYLYEREGTNGENLPETHVFLKKLRKYIDEKYPETVLLAEANMWPEDSASYFGDGDECHMNYHFPVMPRMFMAVQQEDRYPITDIFDQTPAIPETCQWAIFLRNHDELTLEMVTDEERDFMYKAYAKDPKARINLGIRHRLAPLMDNNRSRIELMNSLLFSLPGTPVIYYGDEIGMGDNFYLGDRDGVRTPMQWSSDRNAGFSEANPQQLYLPVILDPAYHYEAVNVEMQKSNTSSLFWFMKRMIGMRKSSKAFSRGDMKFIPVENPKVLAFTRSYKNEKLLVICNLSKFAQPAEIDLHEFKGYVPVELFSKNTFPLIGSEAPYLFTLSPHSFQWFSLQKTNARKNEFKELPIINLEKWEDLLQSENISVLKEEILPSFLKKRKWYKGRNRKIYNINLKHLTSIDFSEKKAYLLLVEINYESGLPETYQLVLTTCEGEEGERLSVTAPESIVAPMKIGNRSFHICDAFYLNAFHQYLIQRITGTEQMRSSEAGIIFEIKDDVRKEGKENKNLNSKMHAGDENNTSITFGNAYFLKLYRKIEAGINPDVEISEYLSDNSEFKNVPASLGTIGFHTENGLLTLGILQQLIENHGDGRSYMMERVNNFIERIMARDRKLFDPFQREGTWVNPASPEEISPTLLDFIGSRAAGQAVLLGRHTANMHKALASELKKKDFQPEAYSLHYQRSLYSSMQSLVRESFQSMEKKYYQLPENVQQELTQVMDKKEEILNRLKNIYSKKLDIWKIRIHGSYTLNKLLFTGKDILIQDFGGNPFRSFSERRLRRTPVRDLAEMITSFYYTTYEAFYSNSQIDKQEIEELLPYADQWAHFISGFFMKSYLEQAKDSILIPDNLQEFELILDVFLIEKALVHLNYELNNRSEWVILPLRFLKSILGISEKNILRTMNT